MMSATRPFRTPMAEAMVVAARKYATQPERVDNSSVI